MDSQLAPLAAALPPTAYLGTSTWTYPGWAGLVYHKPRPGKPKAAELLEEYAQFPLFRTVGIDSAFYGPPSAETLESYARVLPAGFRCVNKVWDRITVHTFGQQAPAKAGQPNPDFLNAELFAEAVLEPYQRYFADHTGPFVFEFQTIPKRSGMGPEEFAAALDRFFRELPRNEEYAVELRNDEFLTPSYFDVLRRHGVAHTYNSWTRMPSIGEQLDLPGSVTAPFVVCRALLRPGRTYSQAVDTFAPYDRIREPNPEVRRDLLRLLGLAATGRGRTVYILVNNRLEGSAPRTIMAVAEQWAAREER
jgi:uncharacterized protein YecE (DUF72 family)